MGATAREQRAIARIEVRVGPDVKFRGTGFLVTRQGLLLTAAHVVFDLDAPGKPRRAGKILLFFATRSSSAPQAVEAEIVENDPIADWALLRCAPPAGIASIEFVDDVPAARTPWTTFGYPDGGDWRQGDGYDGTVLVSHETQLELSSSGIGAAPAGTLAKGLSGAPCLVNGAAVGVINARPNDGKIVAVRADQILIKRPDLRAVRPPYALLFASKLEQLPRAELKALAKRFGMGTDELESQTLHEKVARCMLSCTPDEVARIVRARAEDSLKFKESAARLLLLAETLWVRAEAAARLARFVLADQGRAAAINTGEARAGHHYVARASEAEERFGEWRVCRFMPNVGIETAEAVAKAIRQEVSAALLGALASPNEKQLAAAVKRKQPVIVLVRDDSAQTHYVASLEASLPGLRVVLLSGDALTAEVAHARADLVYITPEIGPTEMQDYEAARDECDDVRRELGLKQSEYAC